MMSDFANNTEVRRLVIVSNRLPFIVEEENGKIKFKDSVGGLVTGINDYLDSLKSSSFTSIPYIWVGWPGREIKKEHQDELRNRAMSDYSSYPVFISKGEMDNFYNGFCNRTIWPLFHCFPDYTVYDENFWNSYKKVNYYFCDTLLKILKPDDILWIHDYHLMLLPKLIREKIPDAKIGFFLHIPFPPFEIYRLLPRKWQIEILEGLLGADLIGLHTIDYTQNLLRCLLRILGLEHNLGNLSVSGRIVKVDTFPMGINYKKFFTAASEIQQDKIKKIKEIFGNTKIILSVDRLDYTKGIINRLEGYELFLEKNPSWHKKVTLMMIVVPSRVGVENYRRVKTKIDELVGKINGRFGTVDWIPIHYRSTTLPFDELVLLYSVSDVALVTPLIDGMNLIAKEYISTRVDGTGVLILSEMAGAAKELGEAILINPNHKIEIADAIKKALEMPLEEQKRRNRIMQERLNNYSVIKWANNFISELLELKEEQKSFNAKLLSSSLKEELIKNFKTAKSRIIFLDYDGTLVPFADRPEEAKPDEELIQLLKELSEYQSTEVILISGRDKDTLENWFSTLDITLVAEHGIWIKEKDMDWRIIKPLNTDWKPKLLPILKLYVDRVPGSFIEEKDFSLVWHYRKADPELASVRAKELMDDLILLTANIDVQIRQGNKVIEVKNAGVDKGSIGRYLISKGQYDFILAIGDDWTDEDLFNALPPNAYSIKVGIAPSSAKFNVRDYIDVRNLIKQILNK